MPRRRRSPFDIFREIDEMFERMFESFPRIELPIEGSYSMEVYRGPDGRTIIKVQLGPDVDREKVEEELRRRYPDAEIIIEGGRTREKFERIHEEDRVRVFRPFAEEIKAKPKLEKRKPIRRRPYEEDRFFVVEKVERLDEEEEE